MIVATIIINVKINWISFLVTILQIHAIIHVKYLQWHVYQEKYVSLAIIFEFPKQKFGTKSEQSRADCVVINIRESRDIDNDSSLCYFCMTATHESKMLAGTKKDPATHESKMLAGTKKDPAFHFTTTWREHHAVMSYWINTYIHT